jgi:GDPmannose 4,6-dehydratase
LTVALVTGVEGQDGWYLARRLVELGTTVIGTARRAAGAIDGVTVVALDLTNMEQIEEVIRTYRPNEIYNFAARASSAQLFDDPLATADVNGVAVARLLEAIRRHVPSARFCQASSSEIFVGAQTSPQDEATSRLPQSAYGAAKAYADHLVAAYRATFGMFACSAILYPHESPRRPPHFLMRKVARAAARIAARLDDTVVLGDLAAVRDWSYAPDCVEAMHKMLQVPEPSDYVIASAAAHTVGEVCEVAFAHVGLDWRKHVTVDEALVRALDPVPRVGDSTRARTKLGWTPTMGFPDLIKHLIEADRVLLTQGECT